MTNETLNESASSRFVSIAEEDLSLKIHYNDFGSGDKTIVMIHGSGPGASGWANFNRNVGPLVDAGYRVILFDCPGWSKSDPIVCSGSRGDLNAKALKGAMDQLGLDKVSLIGNSMGAHSAVAFALRYPARTDRLVLMGGGASGPSLFVPMPPEGIKILQNLYRDPTIDNLKKMMAVFVYDTSTLTDSLFQSRLDNILARRDHLENFVKSLELSPRQFVDYSHRFGEIKSRTLIIWGRDDRFVPLDLGLRTLWGIPNADLHIFGQCGHWAQWEHADKFNRLVLDFMAH